LTLDEAGLIVHASGAISTIFGPKFTQQDACFRQVRMPEPPLLLADRVTGIAGAPASMQTGTVWTETDVIPDAWYLHAGRMPAGIMIESGQADLLLISWLGIDLLNRSERVYRLLGCRLTWGRSLPKPGETLRYEIHVDGHANQGPIRLFFFHYDCWVGDGMALQVRGGQAGFFTDGELAASAGVLWDAASAEPCAPFRVDPPRVDRVPRALDSDALEALAAGDGFDALGVGYERLAPHVHTPTIAGGKMRFLHRITDIDPRGGPWGRGWLRAVQDIAPTDWFFDGHFKNDACMPGTLMFEGCLQAMAAYLIVLGYTLDRDGWRFEPVPDHEVDLRCRGQVIPSSKALVYELFVEEVWDGDQPVLWADLLCTADGLKAFHARRMGLRLVPGWPLERRPHQVAEAVDPVPVAVVDGFSFGYRSLLACAHGQPSHAFGSMYEVFDGTRRVARLPGDPYHFMTRVTKIDGPIGVCRPGAKIALEYDIPPEAWYFEENGFPTMPWCVLLEAILQPCGWLASFVGSARTTDRDLSFRNLDGKGRWLVEVLPTAGTLRTEVTITKVSSSAGMIIQQFELVAYLGTIPVFELETVFGFFPKEALATQIGLPPSEDERRALTAPSTFFADLTRRGEAADHPFFSGTAHLPTGMLCMMDRITGWWPDGGKAGLGRMRGEKDVVPGEWFFKAHFYQDPVQPGSLGLEAVVQLAQAHLIVSKLVDKVPGGRFEPLAIGEAVEWRYRGQVVPTNHLIRSEVEVLEVTVDARGLLAVFEGWLWVDERRIYQAKRFAVRVVPGGDVPAGLVIDPANDRWIHDHSPTWTVPSLPMMSVVDRLAGAALRDRTGRVVTAVEGVSLKRWITVERPIRVEARAVAAPGRRREVALRVDGALVASGVVEVGVEWPAPPMPWVLPADGLVEQANPYEEGRLFHGPAFQMLERWWLGGGYARGLLRAERDGVPRGTLGQGLLDAITHVIPHDDLGRLVPGVSADKAAYPSTVTWLRLYGPLPMAGALEVVARPAPGVPVAADARFVTIDVQVRRPGARDRVLAELRLVEVLMPKGTIGALPPSDRARFLRDRELVAGAGLGARVGDAVMVQAGDVLRSDWLPGTVRAAWRVDGADVAAEVAAKEAVGTRVGAHPGRVRLVSDPSGGVVDAEPLVRVPVAVTRAGAAYTATSDGPPTLDLRPVSAFWDRWFALGRWPVEDLYYGLAERFVRTVRLADPDGIAGVRGRSVLFLGNHQTGLESLMLSILASALLDTPTVTLAKAEHRTSWLGTLIQLCLAYPGARDPRVITYFEREDKASLVGILAELAQDAAVGRSVMVHVEGTRALTARHRVEKMSSAFLDLAVRMNMPVVPVWFAGGLPVEPLAARSEFPVGLGRQDVLLGAPILPATLAAMPYKERKELVIASINALGDPDHEEPHAPDPDLIARVERRAAATGATFDDAVLLEVLCDRAPGSDGAARVVGGAHEGRLMLGDSPEHRWLGRLARRLYGPRGPEVTGG
jgi:3-hydroxymyristoyl/3-hydroxydecanoyl-(acyl carrier protein) dehydratase/1-acyl-sn-glycerol-3-phosphate acyltransferase